MRNRGRPDRRSSLVPLLVLTLLQACAAGSPDPPEGSGNGAGVDLVLGLSPGASGPVWIFESGAEAQPRWVEVRRVEDDEQRIFLREQCAIPDCDGPGGVCGMALPVVRRLDPGDSIRTRWDGRNSRTRVAERCEVREPVPPGEYRVEFCWTREAPDPAADPLEGPGLTGITCRTRSAHFPEDRRVSLIIP